MTARPPRVDDARGPGVVLVVDDAPENLAMLHEALDSAGYRVLVATDGQSALDRVLLMTPDVILLDAVMPGLDGFETCRRLKEDASSAHVPVIFMTGLSDTDHILHGFQAGGIDYLTKPLNTPEVLARIEAHLRNARQMTSARRAVDATGHAMLSIDDGGRVRWQSPAAHEWLRDWLTPDARLPQSAIDWLGGGGSEVLAVLIEGRRLTISRLAGDEAGTTLLVRRRSSVPEPATLSARFGLTTREAEVLYWVACGKINRDVGEILGLSARTVDKHLQHVFEKLNVGTRTAAASMVHDAAPARG
ncbi:MAG: response regulator [Burkholderiaceae bacterium]|jgi:DNA-binding NarL/FixJ family response regulator